MKNKIILILSAILILLTIFALVNNNSNDSIKFKLEYEKLNNKDNGYGNNYLTLNIDINNKIKYSSFKEIENILTNDTGVIYFGFPECPWCRNMIEPLLNAANESEIKTIYYFNAKDIRDVKKLNENNEIITEKEGTEEYKKLIDLLYDNLGEYEGLNDKTIKRLYFPTVVFVKEGKIKNIHIGTLDEQKNPFKPLDEKQKNNLKNLYLKYISSIKSSQCDDKC